MGEGNNMLLRFIKEGYQCKEWKDKETDGHNKHRLYVVGPHGEIGHYDFIENQFNNSAKTSDNFDYVDDSGDLHKSININSVLNSFEFGLGIYTFQKIN